MIIRANDHVHLGTFAPAGAGKGVAAVIPILRSYRGSVVIVDSKGENFTLSAEHRQRRFSHRTARLDPFAVCGTVGDSLNPLDFLDPASPDLLDACRDIANMIVHRTGTEPDPHWNDSAERCITAFIYFVASCETDLSRRNLLAVRGIIRSRDAYLATLGIMRQHGGMVKQQADSLSWLQDKELSSTLSVAQRHTAWMDSPPVSACLQRSTFDPRELRGGKLDLYYVLPPERLGTLSPLLRLWLGSTLRILVRGPASEAKPVLFLVDEAAHIGRMQMLEDAITLMRGYGIRIWLFFQSINQLQKCYGDNAQTILDNLGTQQYFGISNSFDTAEAISKRIGDCTILQRSTNDTKGHSRSTGPTQGGGDNASSSLSVTTSEMARRWAKAEEIMTLPADMGLVFHRNMPVIPVKLCKYYESKAFRRGRTGDDTGLGLAAGLVATLLLLASLTLSAFVAVLPPPARPQPSIPSPPPAAAVPPANVPQRPGIRPPLPNRNPRRDRLPSRSGYLVPIR